MSIRIIQRLSNRITGARTAYKNKGTHRRSPPVPLPPSPRLARLYSHGVASCICLRQYWTNQCLHCVYQLRRPNWYVPKHRHDQIENSVDKLARVAPPESHCLPFFPSTRFFVFDRRERESEGAFSVPSNSIKARQQRIRRDNLTRIFPEFETFTSRIYPMPSVFPSNIYSSTKRSMEIFFCEISEYIVFFWYRSWNVALSNEFKERFFLERASNLEV